MRLEELRLIAYGPFTDCTLRLKPGFNVLYGPNEAGKSSALRAVHALLFGVLDRTKDDFVHNKTQLRIGGVLVESGGRELSCVRRKGRKATLRDGGDDQPLDEGLLSGMLGGVNEEFFTSVFGIDHQRLRDGGKEVVRGEGRVGELLFAAGGVSHLRDLQRALEEDAAKLFKSTGRNPRINSALSQLKQLDVDIRQLQRSPDEWARHDTEHRKLRQLAKTLTEELEDVESTRSRLDRINSALQFLATWKEKRSELDMLAGVISLPADAEERFREANEKRTIAAVTQKDAKQRIDNLQRQLGELQVPTKMLHEAGRIDQLYRRLGNHEKDIADRSVLAGQQRTARDNAKRTIAKLGWPVSLDEATKRRLADDKKARVRALASRHGEVTLASVRQQQTLERLRERMTELGKQVEDEPHADDPQSLKDILATTLPALDAEDRLPELREEVDRLQRQADRALASLPQWNEGLENLCRLKVPTIEAVDQFDETNRKVIGRLEKLTEQLEGVQSEEDRCREALAALELANLVPTEEELLASREVRDRGLRLAVQKLTGESVESKAVEEFVSEVADASDFASAIEPSVRQADAIADRLRREADRVAEKTQLVAQSESVQRRAAKIADNLAKAEKAQTIWAADWEHFWENSTVSPSTTSEMRGWLRKHAELVSIAGELTSTAQQLAAEEKRLGSLRRLVSGELLRSGVEIPDAVSLRQLTQLGQRQVEAAEKVCREHQQRELDLKRQTDSVQQAEKEAKSAKENLKQWQADWAVAIKPLQLPPESIPEQAEAVLTNLDELFRNLDDAEGFRKRIWGIDETAKEFTQSAHDLASSIAPELAEQPVEEIASTLNQKLSDARQAEQRMKSLAEQLEDEHRSVGEAEQLLADGTAVLQALVVEASCEGVADLPTVIEKSQRKHRIEDEVTKLQLQLAPLCAGRRLDEFLTDAESEDADRLPTKIGELDSRIRSLRDERDAAIAGKERAASCLEQYDGAAGAAEKAVERQFLITQIEEDAREYAVAKVACHLLQRAVERYQEKAQGPVLSAASEHFRKLTCGAFDGLRADYDESGQEVLVGVRPDGVILRVEAMSEGSRDQLYLALRLATIDYWFETHDPVPFIVDDVLLSFDDARAEATLQVLLHLSGRTQVLFFTHHDHLVALTRKVSNSNGFDSTLHLIG